MSEKKGLLAGLGGNLRDYGMLFSLVVILAIFEVATGGTILMPLNVTNIILQNSYIIIMAVGMMIVIVAGHIDLSIGSTAAFIGAVGAILMVNFHWDPILATLACLVVGAAVGAAQGYFVAYAKIPSFIVTLAGMLLFRGLTLNVLGGQFVGPFAPEFQALSVGFIPDPLAKDGFRITSLALTVIAAAVVVFLNLRTRAKHIKYEIDAEPALVFWIRTGLSVVGFVGLGYLMASYRGLPNVLVIMFLLVVIYVFITTRTTVGRRIYAIGGNEKAARLSGINTERLNFLTFVNMGVLAALGGMVLMARFNSATPKAGTSLELDVIAACFIGGASTSGGVGKITGAVIGAFIMGVMNNGMSILGIGIDYQMVIKGLVLLAAVWFDVYNKAKG